MMYLPLLFMIFATMVLSIVLYGARERAVLGIVLGALWFFSVELSLGWPTVWQKPPQDAIFWYAVGGDQVVASPLSEPGLRRLYTWEYPDELPEQIGENGPVVMQKSEENGGGRNPPDPDEGEYEYIPLDQYLITKGN